MIRRSWTPKVSFGLVVIGVVASTLQMRSRRVDGLDHTRLSHGSEPLGRVLDKAMSLKRAPTYDVSSGQIAFSRSGHLQTSYWSLNAVLTNGWTGTIGVSAAELGRLEICKEPTSSSPVELGAHAGPTRELSAVPRIKNNPGLTLKALILRW